MHFFLTFKSSQTFSISVGEADEVTLGVDDAVNGRGEIEVNG